MPFKREPWIYITAAAAHKSGEIAIHTLSAYEYDMEISCMHESWLLAEQKSKKVVVSR